MEIYVCKSWCIIIKEKTMRTVNKVILIGNVTRDPLVKNTEGWKKISMFTIATNRYYKTADGENKSEAEFHNCVAWGALAERVEEFVTKWKLLYIEWRLKTRVIEKDGGEKLFKTEVVAGNVIFLSKKEDFEEIETEIDNDLDDDMF